MDKIPLSEILKLSVDERLELIDRIWDSIDAEPDAAPLSDELREELDRRLAAAKAEPGVGYSWDEVRARLLVPE